MSFFTAIDLAKLPAPEIIQQVDFEEMLAEMKATAISFMPDLAATLDLESEPATQLLRVFAHYRMLDRLMFNDDARGLLLALSSGATLDVLGANWGVPRLVLQEADDDATPPVPEILEDDEAFRRRIPLSMEARSTAGPRGSYTFYALSASGAVKDVDVRAPRFKRHVPSPELAALLPPGGFVLVVEDDAGLNDPLPGDVAVTALEHSGDGTLSNAVLTAIEQALNGEETRPLTDRPRVRGADILRYQIDATLHLKSGPDTSIVMQAAKASAQAFIESNHRLGNTITIGAIYAALFVEGVERVDLRSPAADIEVGAMACAYCASEDLTLSQGGSNV
ncbi:baseplate assembly protein [Epibacterium ulvae]|uniref:baseplate assembly protein n=1 Tax=Epibacterium ulvae TaxID=1156985 RepID=UPI002491370A|nr:baseplate J/gp47 family protein [Epibacterium ulvae]